MGGHIFSCSNYPCARRDKLLHHSHSGRRGSRAGSIAECQDLLQTVALGLTGAAGVAAARPPLGSTPLSARAPHLLCALLPPYSLSLVQMPKFSPPRALSRAIARHLCLALGPASKQPVRMPGPGWVPARLTPLVPEPRTTAPESSPRHSPVATRVHRVRQWSWK